MSHVLICTIYNYIIQKIFIYLLNMIAIAFATDEDVCLRASSDYSILCPRDQKIAWGCDGVILPTDPWTITSASVDFLLNGIKPGQIIQLTRPTSSFRPPGEALAIDSVRQGAVTLRRKGQASREGQPPATTMVLSGIEFTVATLSPQIALASYELNRRFGINNLVAGRRASDLYDIQEVKEATVLTVLFQQYTDMSRGIGDRVDSFAVKAQIYKQELDEVLARAVVHWRTFAGATGTESTTTRMSTRLER